MGEFRKTTIVKVQETPALGETSEHLPALCESGLPAPWTLVLHPKGMLEGEEQMNECVSDRRVSSKYRWCKTHRSLIEKHEERCHAALTRMEETATGNIEATYETAVAECKKRDERIAELEAVDGRRVAGLSQLRLRINVLEKLVFALVDNAEMDDLVRQELLQYIEATKP